MSATQPITDSSNTSESTSMEYTKQNVIAMGNKVRLSDSNTEEELELYCYNKCTNSDEEFLRNCRGLVFHKDQLILKAYSYTPEYSEGNCDDLKSILGDDFSSYKFYDAHEGALLRVFNFNDKWYVSTHRKIDSFRSKWSSKQSFGEMFKNAIEFEYNKENSTIKEKVGETDNIYEGYLNSLDKNTIYMFLVKNTFENRIVCAATEDPTVYSVGSFSASDFTFSMENDSGIQYPGEHTFASFDDMRKHVVDGGFEKTAGIVIFGDNNRQWKLLNREYVDLFNARGNEPSIKYRYLQVRMDRDKTNMLYFLYPRYADTFDDYENALYDIARNINNNYIRRFIKKKYVTVPKEEYLVMKACHTWHLEDRAKNRISLRKVIELLNEQTPTNLNKIIRRHNNEKNSEGVHQKRPRAKSDLDEEVPPAPPAHVDTLPPTPPSPDASSRPPRPTQVETQEPETAF